MKLRFALLDTGQGITYLGISFACWYLAKCLKIDICCTGIRKSGANELLVHAFYRGLFKGYCRAS
jgi:hypothetical protein